MPRLRGFLCARPTRTAIPIASTTAPLASNHAAAPNPYFAIQVIDDQTGRGVPLVELTTTNAISYFTDSAGMVAFNEPGMMGLPVFFQVKSDGYECPSKVFGKPGVTLKALPGGKATIRLKRINIAERLYRFTGAGIYRDSVLLEIKPPTAHPVMNGLVAGQDSVLAVPYRGKIYWFWGDTGRISGPLGHFRTAGATSQLPGQGGLDPAVGVNLNYFVDKVGFSRPMCPLPDRKTGAVWISGTMTLPAPAPGSGTAGDSTGEILVTHYTLMKDLGTMVEHGLMIFDNASQTFQRYVVFDLDEKQRWRSPNGHPVLWHVDDQDYELFAVPFPTVRVKADLRSVADPNQYEAFTCLAPGSRYDKAKSVPQRDASGRLMWGWKLDTDPVGEKEERELIAARKIKPEEARFQLHDAVSGNLINYDGGSLCYNSYRHKCIMIGCEIFGKPSFLGEAWFAEADQPTGPWSWARKIVTHKQYSFYNPTQFSFFDQQDGRFVYFAGTYSDFFTGITVPTPRYNYNQIMYRLDLSDPRLVPPVPNRWTQTPLSARGNLVDSLLCACA